MLIDKSLDAVANNRNVEIDEKTEATIIEFKVGKQLRFMDRQDFFNGFQLDNHLSFNEQINIIAHGYIYIAINNRYRYLPFNLQSH